jgi:TPR repeat protein
LDVSIKEKEAADLMNQQNFERAAVIMESLCEYGSEYSLLGMGWIYEVGATGLIDEKRAYEFYKKAKDLGSIPACLYLGNLLKKQGKNLESVKIFKNGAESGNIECMNILNNEQIFQAERSAAAAIDLKEYGKAKDILISISERESEYAMLTLGWLYSTGKLGQINNEEARVYFDRAVAAGSAEAHFHLGRLFERSADRERARREYEAGARLENLPCISRIGRMMVKGWGGPVDFERGLLWLSKASDGGSISAKATLLHFELRRTNSSFRKIVIWFSLFRVCINAVIENYRDPLSERLK